MKGAATSALNPKVFLLFLALLPQFTEPDTGWPLGCRSWRWVGSCDCAVIYTGVGAWADLC